MRKLVVKFNFPSTISKSGKKCIQGHTQVRIIFLPVPILLTWLKGATLKKMKTYIFFNIYILPTKYEMKPTVVYLTISRMVFYVWNS